MKTDRDKIIEVLKEADHFYLISHMQPDGDSIGSLLAMGEGLKSMGKQVRMFTPGYIPRKYSFLKGAGQVKHDIEDCDPGITAVILDSSDADRLGIFKESFMECRTIINIDHHVTNQWFGTLNLVDSDASATGEIIYHLLKEIGAPIDYYVAEALYVAISTDTGSFKYENTMPGTHRVVAGLLDKGLSPGALSQRIFDERPLSFYVMLREAISSLEMYGNRKIAVMTLSKDIRQRSGASADELEGIVNYTRNIEGIELGILFYVENGGEVKVGFRSKTVDVSVLAGRLNGGGHARAAGCRLYEDYGTVKEKVLAESLKMLKGQTG